jgi:glucose-1-phosphate thymidylyltransferase
VHRLNPIGIIPAAGFGTRFLPYRYPKELFPIAFQESPEGRVSMRVVVQDALESLVRAGVRRAYVVIGDHKFETMRFLSDGHDFGVELAYLHQREVAGLPGAVDCAYPWLEGSNVVLLLPDTLIEPRDCVASLLTELDNGTADVVLAVFETEHPGDLCPVEFDRSGKVSALYDKDSARGINNTWGLAVWNPRFTEFLHEYLRGAKGDTEVVLASVFLAAIKNDLCIHAIPIPGGRFIDIGRSASLIEAQRAMEDRLRRADSIKGGTA